MTYDLYRVLQLAVFAPSYVVILVGLSRVLGLRRAHPRACWLSVAAWSVAVLFGTMNAVRMWALDWNAAADWGQRTGLGVWGVHLVLDVALSALQTLFVTLQFAATLTGRRRAP